LTYNIPFYAAIDEPNSNAPLTKAYALGTRDFAENIIHSRIEKGQWALRGEMGSHGPVTVFMQRFDATEKIGVRSDQVNEVSSIQAYNAGDALLFEPLIQGLETIPMKGFEAIDSDDNGGSMSFSTFKTPRNRQLKAARERRNTVVAYEWVGKAKDLAIVGRIRYRFTIPDHSCSKNEFPTCS
jgi:hypothetical protein